MYAPTYLFIAEEQKLSRLPYIVKSIPSRVGKGKAKADPEFERERAWLLEHVQDVVAHDEQVAEELNEQEYEDCGDGIECGCCFSTYPFVRITLILCLIPNSDTNFPIGQDDTVSRLPSLLYIMYDVVCLELVRGS